MEENVSLPLCYIFLGMLKLRELTEATFCAPSFLEQHALFMPFRWRIYEPQLNKTTLQDTIFPK